MNEKLLALRSPQKDYATFPATEQGLQEAEEFIGDGSATIYLLDHYTDKHGDILPRVIGRKEVNSE